MENKINDHDYCHISGSMVVNIHTNEKMIAIGDQVFSLRGLLGKPIYVEQELVDELCYIEDSVNNYLEY